MKIFQQPSLWVAVSAVAIWWLADLVIGTETNRNVLAWLAIIVCAIYATTNLPYAIKAFRDGGRQRNWRLLMGNVLFPYGFAARELWAWLVRDAGRPDWMVYSPVNGFFTLWIFGGILLCYSASAPETLPIPQGKLYYIVLATVAGVLIGLAAGRFIL